MNPKSLSVMLLRVIAILCLIVGVRYTTTTSILGYHEAFIGVRVSELPGRTHELLLNFLHLAGVEFMALSVMLALLSRGPFARGEPWAWWCVALTMLPVLGVLTVLSFAVGPQSPQKLAVAVLVLMLTTLTLGRPARYWPLDAPPSPSS
ncbi:hypothetical protein L6R49_11000 [Myxococcota bacterium]|nr:hypothetical protein [Myxococcota bacterium]